MGALLVMIGKNSRKTRSPAWFFLIAGICAIALLAATVQAAGNDSVAGNPLFQLTKKKLSLSPFTKPCVMVSAPPRNTGDLSNDNGLAVTIEPSGGSVIQEQDILGSNWFECAYIDVECWGYTYHEGKRYKESVGKTKSTCWAAKDYPFYCGEAYNANAQYYYACKDAYPDIKIISGRSISGCYE